MCANATSVHFQQLMTLCDKQKTKSSIYQLLMVTHRMSAAFFVYFHLISGTTELQQVDRVLVEITQSDVSKSPDNHSERKKFLLYFYNINSCHKLVPL